MVRAIEDLGFDSIWLGEHLLYRWADRARARPVGGLDDCWPAIAAATTRVEFGPLVACTNFHNPALLAKQAATIDEISGGRFILGLGAGWNETEFRAFGFPFDHRVDRFEEAFTIIRTLLREGAIDFDGRFYQARDCELLPRGPRPGGPPLLIGSNGPRMLRITMPHADAWNAGSPTSTTARRASPRCATIVDAAVRDVGRDPADDRAHGRGPRPAARAAPDASRATTREADPPPLEGPPEEMADELRAYAARASRTSSWSLDPITIGSIEPLAPVLAELDRG